MLVAIVPLVACVIGLLMYALCANPKLQEIGRLTFGAGMLALLFVMSGKSVSL